MAFKVPEEYRFTSTKGDDHPLSSTAEIGNNGYFQMNLMTHVNVIASDGDGWEHVSVSTPNRCPTWEEMCAVKNKFWDPEDVVIQFHPKESEYVNHHPYTLHMWRKVGQEHETPPTSLIGPMNENP